MRGHGILRVLYILIRKENAMKDIVLAMIQHPFRTMIVLGAVGGLLSEAIKSFNSIKPKTVVDSQTTKESK